MNEPGYREALVDYVRQQAKPPDKFSHQPRLYQLARRLAENQPYDDDVLFAAAWLHDLGVFVGHRPADSAALSSWDHLAYAAKEAPNVLKRLGFPAEKIPIVCEAILTHLPSGKPVSFEGVLVRDADILEQLGAIGALRIVSKIGRDMRYIRFSDALHLLHRNLEQLPPQLQLPSARRLARGRIESLAAFLEAAGAEAGGCEL